MERQRAIAVIDDDPEFVDMVREILHDAGYGPVFSLDGGHAWMQITRNQPALLIVDIHGRQDNRRDFVRMLRQDYRTHHIPVIISSTEPDFFSRNRGLFDDQQCAFLEKPFYLTELLDLVRACLGR